MRTMSTQMGSTAGVNGRTEGLPEVQESVLEHAPTETRQEKELTADKPVVKSTDVVRKTDVKSLDGIRERIASVIVSYTGMYRPIARDITDEILCSLELCIAD